MIQKKTFKILFAILIFAMILSTMFFPQLIAKSGKVVITKNLNIEDFSAQVTELTSKYSFVADENEISFPREKVTMFEDEYLISKQDFENSTDYSVSFGANKLRLIKKSEQAQLLSFQNNARQIEIDLSENLAIKEYALANQNAEVLNFEESNNSVVPLNAICETLNLNINTSQKDIIISSQFATARLIVVSNSEFPTFGACEIISGFKDYHILQYSTPSKAKEAYEKISKIETIYSVEPDARVYVDATASTPETPNLTQTSAQGFKTWGADAMCVPDYLSYLSKIQSVGSLNEVIVAVLDTGIDETHPMMAGRIVTGGKSFVASEQTTRDRNGHGTHVSGTIIDLTPANVKIMPVKVLDASGSGTTAKVVSAIEYVTSLKASVPNLKVINMSLGAVHNTNMHSAYQNAINNALNVGILSVASSGNDNRNLSNYNPANIESALTIGSVTQNNNTYIRSSFSNYGTTLDLTAPGKDILSAGLNHDYVYMSGTSMAAPHASASVALLLSDSVKNYSVLEVETILKENAMDLGITGPDSYFGYGLINLTYIGVEICAPPIFSREQETFEESFNLLLTCAEPNVRFCYTLDGSKPTETNGILYSGGIQIDRTINVQAFAYKVEGGRITSKSPIVGKTYYFGTLEDLPEKFTIDASGTITNYSGTKEELKVQSVINGIEVKAIGKRAFENVKKLYLPETCEVIKEEAFWHWAIEYVSAPGVKIIEKQAFYETSITRITDAEFPALREIGKEAFFDTLELTEVKLTNLEILGEDAFSCWGTSEVETGKLEIVEIPNVKVIPRFAFEHRKGLKTVKAQHAETIQSYAFYKTKIAKAEFPSLKVIGTYAFYNCERLTQFSCAEVVNVGAMAFFQCGALNQVDLPKAKIIGSGAFYGCENLETIYIGNCESLYNEAFYNCEKLRTINIHKVKEIGVLAFGHCEALTSVYLPDVLIINNYAFEFCELKSLEISPYVEKIADNAFSRNYLKNCALRANTANNEIKKLINFCSIENVVNIGNNVNEIFSYSVNFAGTEVCILGINENIAEEEITIPAKIDNIKVTKIAQNALKDCEKIVNANLLYVKNIEESAFENCLRLESVYAPEIEIIGEKAFLNCSALENAQIENAKEIGAYAFFNCERLVSVEIGKNITQIGSYALGFVGEGTSRGVNPLFVLNVCESVGRGYAEENAVEFTMRYQEGMHTITYEFADRWVPTELKIKRVDEGKEYGSIEIPSEIDGYPVVEIDSRAFFGTTFKYVKLPNSVKSIGGLSFGYCESLVEIEMNGVLAISDQAFYNCSSLKRVYAQEALNVYSYAFNNCIKLEELYASKIELITSGAFNYCLSLTKVYLPNLIEIRWDPAFYASGVKELYIGNALTSCMVEYSLGREENNATIYSYTGSLAENLAMRSDANFVDVSAFGFDGDLENVENVICGEDNILNVDAIGMFKKYELYVSNTNAPSSFVKVAESDTSELQFSLNDVGTKYAYVKVVDFNDTSIDSNVFTINVLNSSTLLIRKTGNGILSFEGYKELAEHGNFTLDITETKAYHLKDIKINFKSLSKEEIDFAKENGLVFNDVVSPKNVEIIFEIAKYKVTASAGEGGQISNKGEIELEYGSNSPAYTYSPKIGYEISAIKIDGVDLVGEELQEAIELGYEFLNVEESHTIHIEFKLIDYVVNVTCDENGEFEIVGGAIKHFCDIIEITLMPNTGYEVDKVLVNGEDKTSSVSGNKIKIAQNTIALNVDVTFKETIYVINEKIKGNGLIEFDSNEDIKYGQSRLVTVKAKEGSQIYQVRVNGAIVELNDKNQFLLENITANIDVDVICLSDFEMSIVNFFSHPSWCIKVVAGFCVLIVIISLLKRIRIGRRKINKN